MTFKPGQSGNPGGRPKGLERTAREAMAIRKYTAADGVEYEGDRAAFQCLLDMFFDEDTPARERVAAFREWCDRGFGKAKQSIKVSGDQATEIVGRKPEEMTDDELTAAIEAIATLKRLGAVDAGDVPEH
jgi:hypothetical protein